MFCRLCFVLFLFAIVLSVLKFFDLRIDIFLTLLAKWVNNICNSEKEFYTV